WVDDGTLPPGDPLDETVLTGNYSYYITFAQQPGPPPAGEESRPTKLLGPVNVVNGRIQISNIPVPAGEWSYVRIYRNLADDENSFHFVDWIDTPTFSGGWTDNFTDEDIEGNPTIDLDGPRIGYNTLLVDVLRRDGPNYLHVFEEGTLQFTGRKGGRSLATKEFTITDTTTVQELLTFMEEALGIQRPPGPDTDHPILYDGVTGESPGGSIQNGRIRIVSNTGTANAVSIGLSGMQLEVGGIQSNINLPFSSAQTARGESAVADFIAYDSLGIPISVRITATLEARTSTTTVYRWYADSPDNQPATGVDIAVGTGLITFDGEGNFVSATNSTVSIERREVASQSPLEFQLDFSQLSGLAVDTSTLAVSRQDGSAPGVLTSFIVGEDGCIRGVFSNGVTRDLGQIILARFANPAGLEQRGQNLFAAGVNSGLPVMGRPNEQGLGQIISGAVELSNTDIGGNLVDLILAATMYRSNTRVISTSQQMLDELLSINR
ncbi:MAG TPA: flagellar hook-basal body complex protein, partial [Thermoguttaceae bacterium]|nr:flagellar hook-basal body complex protein [Thermoguttaceae bacterium]